MSRFASNKVKPSRIGMVGDAEVLDYNGCPCIVIKASEDSRGVWISASKAKAVLANTDKLKQFLVEYDKPKVVAAPVVSAPAMSEGDQAALTAMQAQIAQLTSMLAAQMKGGKAAAPVAAQIVVAESGKRFDPLNA